MSTSTIETTTPYSYMCSMSPICKMVIGAACGGDKFRRMVESVVNDIAGNEEIAISLKQYNPLGRYMREVDIKKSPDDTDVIFKCFVFWDHGNDLWHVLVEGGLEDYWEKQGKEVPPVGLN